MNRNAFRIARASTVLLVVACVSFAQAPPFVSTNPSQILNAFQAARGNWVANIAGYANALFGSLAVIEFAWSAAVMVLEKADLQSWTAALVRKIMWIGGFYMLLINGPVWIPFIIDSFTQIGQNSSGVMSISPSNVFGQGIVVAAGFIFLGFGGSRWTAPYAELYIGLAVSNSVKILVIYLLISVGTNLGNAWVAEAQGASTSASPEMVALDVMAAALMYMMLCWQIPKLFSAVLGGSPALAGGDLISAGASLIAGGAAVAAVASGGAGVLAGGARAFGGVGAAASAGTGSPLTVSSAGDIGSTGLGGGSVPPPGPTGSGQGSGFGSSRQPEPPGSSGSSGVNVTPASSETSPPNGAVGQAAGAAENSQDTLGSVSARMRNLGRRLNSVLPPDHAPHSTPPRMDIDHHD